MTEPTLSVLSQSEQERALPQAITPRWNVFAHALFFVLGFSLVFTVGWGGTVTVLGQLFGQYKFVLGGIGGVTVIVFGLTIFQVILLFVRQSD